MGLRAGDKIIANDDYPGETSNVKKGMTGVITKVDESGWTTNWLIISWEEGKYQDRVKFDSTKITKI